MTAPVEPVDFVVRVEQEPTSDRATRQTVELRAIAFSGEKLALRLTRVREFATPAARGNGGQASHGSQSAQINLDAAQARDLLPVVFAAAFGVAQVDWLHHWLDRWYGPPQQRG